ncbi:agmatinase [Streptomyces lancefieldiae]|uniref:Agmatinase n=1 Tax=Streptomyces lancefieldiae TaxID=3075520 RepID=A0ABU3APT4_9ACTN|nr:agmatinase [Streptomyces sp. DSM 40712]MDT0610876.1 agmatinase [Streptomyces sp. DSM 40712]
MSHPPLTMFGPRITFLGVDACDLDDPATYADADVVILGAPLDGGTTYRSGARFGPSAVRQACYLPQDGSRPSLALRVDALKNLKVYDAGDVFVFSGDMARSVERIEAAVFKIASSGAVPVVLGGDHSIAWPDHTGVARHHGFGKVSMIHFDAHADTADIQFGSLVAHGTPMRRLIESGALRGDRFVQVGLRGYWPDEPVLTWMKQHRLRSFEMTEIVERGLDDCLTEAAGIALDDCTGVFLSVDVDVVDPGSAPGTGTPEPGGLSPRQLLDAVRRLCYELPVVGLDLVEVAPPFDHADVTALLGNRVVLEALSAIARRRRDQREGTTWDPREPLLHGRDADEQLDHIANGRVHGHRHSTDHEQ